MSAPDRSRECKGCGGSGDVISTQGIPAGMECGAQIPQPWGLVVPGTVEVRINRNPPIYCGEPAKYRNRTKNTGDGGFYEHGDPSAFLCAEHAENGRRNPCPACLGSGRVTDGPFRRDAEVDAETLRVLAFDMPGTRFAVNVHAASYYGRGVKAGWWPDEFFGMCAGELAARAAFRAVPALRGED